MATERCLVTGATGSLGRTLVRRLLADGHPVRVLFRDPADARDPAFHDMEPVFGDLLRPESLAGAAADVHTVYHLAGITHTNRPRLYHDVNVGGTESLLRVCRDAGIARFVYFGSRADHPSGGAYSRSKGEAAALVRRSGVPFTTLRIAEVYGGSGDAGLGIIARLVESFPVVPVLGGESFQLCPVHVDDVVRAAVDVVRTDVTLNRVYVIAGPECHSLQRIVELAMAHRGSSRPKVRVPVMAVAAAARLHALIPGTEPFLVRDQIARLASPKESDISPARADFRFEPRGVSENLDALF